MKFDGVIFDLDGTLLDTLRDLCDSTNHALASFGFPRRSLEEIRSFVGNGIGNLVARSLPENTDAKTFEKVLSVFKEHYAKNSRNKTAPYPGIAELLEDLKREGVKTAVVSNKADFAVQTLVDDFFPGLVTVAIGELSGVARKPDPATTLLAMEKMGTCNVVYVGDSEVDVETAKNANISGIFVDWGFRSEKQLRESGAETVVHSAKELYERLV